MDYMNGFGEKVVHMSPLRCEKFADDVELILKNKRQRIENHQQIVPLKLKQMKIEEELEVKSESSI